MINKHRLYLLYIITLIITSVCVYNIAEAGREPADFSDLSLNFLYSPSKDILTAGIGIRDGIIIGFFTTREAMSAETREAGTSNYGQTKIEEIDTVTGMDIGYTQTISEHLVLGTEASIGVETHYSKYSDHRFTEDYYLSEESSKWVFGIGLIVTIPINKKFELASSYNSIKGTSLGIIIRF